MLALGVAEIVLYGIALVLCIYNIFFFMLKQKTYRLCFVLSFYILGTLTVLFRLILAILVVTRASHGTALSDKDTTIL